MGPLLRNKSILELFKIKPNAGSLKPVKMAKIRLTAAFFPAILCDYIWLRTEK